MRVFNLTDVSTPALKAASLENVSITVGSESIAPGTSGEMKKYSSHLARLFQCGALAYEQPSSYLRAKGLREVNTTLVTVNTVAVMPELPAETPAETPAATLEEPPTGVRLSRRERREQRNKHR